MRYLIAVAGAAAVLVLAGAAWAGGWATVGFEPLPDGTPAGGTWHPTIVVKQHGVTPLGGLQPVVTIEDVASGERRTFTALATSVVGEYEADVVFPSAGDWRLGIDSGFGDSRVTYGPFTVGAPGAVADPGRDFPLPLAATALVGLLLAAGALLVARRAGRVTPASR